MSEPQGSEGTTQRLPVIEKAEPELGQSESAAAYEPRPALEGEDGRTHRFWSARRVPAAVVATLLLVVAGTFLYDIAAVRADQRAMFWRRELARQLAERPLDDTWVLVGAGVAAALGLWLIVLAATPGLRDVLPMRRTHPDVRAGLHRGAAATVLRDRAMEVSGVQSVRVRMRRRRADVRAVSHFRELDDVRADLDEVLADAIRALGLSRRPALSVHVRRPGRKG
ncbi:hypothetical protein SSP24_20080 [Streptomyces spinoverrucosus]|uniref:DUF6286 domain-containing protein n=1 Tax=Streptomyces spinoverrucosus TaxID=284043 RepID=A0A4Y3VD58_9ACTN|nr:DUF6286 domain-containing protein [Streptomyces spinoverrucosus]GEC04353.1 hypothetical protein SSP24_20080 [Streptomyces spinoverrucosus]GHB47961.1 hypothetical protein GCM10010397_17540 [Streptomyces spinoverrucosus]